MAVSENVIEEFTTRRIVENDADKPVRLDDLVKLDDIRVFKGL